MSVILLGKLRLEKNTGSESGKISTGRFRGEGRSLVDSLLLIVARVGANLLALVWTFLLARMLAPEQAGIVFQVMALAQIASALVTLNVESGSLRFLTGPMAARDLDQATGFIRFNRRLNVVLCLPVLVGLGLVIWRAGSGQVVGLLSVIVIAGGAVPLIALARMTARHATALGAVRYGLLPRLLSGPAVLALGLLGMYWAGTTPTVAAVLALYALSEAVAALIQQFLLRHHFAFLKQARGSFADWRAWMGQGLWLSPGLVMTEYRKSMLIAAASLVLTDGDVSRFAVAFSIVNFINFGVVAVDVAFSPRIASALATDQPARCNHLLRLSAVIKLAGLALGVLLVFAFGRAVLGLFGPEYAPAQDALYILLLLPLVSILAGPWTVLLSSQGQGRADFIVNVSGAVVTLLAIGSGGWIAGLEGAAWGAAAAAAFMSALGAWMCQRSLGVDATALSLLQRGAS